MDGTQPANAAPVDAAKQPAVDLSKQSKPDAKAPVAPKAQDLAAANPDQS